MAFNPTDKKITEAYSPKIRASSSDISLGANVSTVESTPAMTLFAQQVISLTASPKKALTTLQNTLVSETK